MTILAAQADAQATGELAQARTPAPARAPAVQAVGIAQAAQAFGVSTDTIRRRLRKGELRGEQVRTPQGFVWQVLLPVAVLDGAAPAVPPPPAPDEEPPRSDPGAGSGTPEVRRLEEHVADLRAQLHRLELELEARRREVGELHTLLGMAQRALPVPEVHPATLGAAPAGGPGPAEPSDGANEAPAHPQPAEPPPGGPPHLPWWRRIWHLGSSA